MAFRIRSKLSAAGSSLGRAATPNSRASVLGLGLGAVPDVHLRSRARAAPRSPRARSRRRPSPARACPPAGAAARRGCPTASVFSASIRPSLNVSVLAAPISARRGGRLVGGGQRGELVRDGHVDAGEAARGKRGDQRARSPRARPRSPRRSTRARGRARRARRSASRASASGRPVGRGRRGAASAEATAAQHSVGEPPSACKRGLILGLRGGELRLGLDEGVLVAGARLDHVIEVVRLGGVRGGLERGQAGVADRPGRQAGVDPRVVRRVGSFEPRLDQRLGRSSGPRSGSSRRSPAGCPRRAGCRSPRPRARAPPAPDLALDHRGDVHDVVHAQVLRLGRSVRSTLGDVLLERLELLVDQRRPPSRP